MCCSRAILPPETQSRSRLTYRFYQRALSGSLCRVAVGLPYKDPTYAFRGFDLDFVRALGLKSGGFEISPEMTLQTWTGRADPRARGSAGAAIAGESKFLFSEQAFGYARVDGAFVQRRFVGPGPAGHARPPRRIDRQLGVPGRLKVLSVVGARPNMMKVAPVAATLRRARTSSSTSSSIRATLRPGNVAVLPRGARGWRARLPAGRGFGTQAQQTARALERVEEVLSPSEPTSVLSRATSTRHSQRRLRRKLAVPGSATSRRASGASTARCPRRCPEQPRGRRGLRPALHPFARGADEFARRRTQSETIHESGTR